MAEEELLKTLRAVSLTTRESGEPRTGCKWEKLPPDHVLRENEDIRTDLTWSPNVPDSTVDEIYNGFKEAPWLHYLYIDNGRMIWEFSVPPDVAGATVSQLSAGMKMMMLVWGANSATCEVFKPVPLFFEKYKLPLIIGLGLGVVGLAYYVTR